MDNLHPVMTAALTPFAPSPAKAQHTPGPWTLNPARSTRVDLIDNAKGHAIGEIVWVDVRNPADASLIAAAPNVLEALKNLLQEYDDAIRDEYSGTKLLDGRLARADFARAAIAKATGGAA